jgi:hypothetical protein
MLNDFKTFVASRLQIEDLVALSAFGRQLRDEYLAHGVEVPEYVDTHMKSLKREIRARVADKLEARRKELQAKIQNAKTPAQRLQEARKELKAVEEQLADA